VSTAIDDDLWSAVGDPTRRRMLDLLLADGGGTRPRSASGCPSPGRWSPSTSVCWTASGLVHVTRAGGARRHEVDQAQLARAVAQLSAVGATWDARLQRIKRIAERIERSKPG
jgi:hypothetical protein